MLTGQLVQRLRLFYRSKTIFVGLLPLSDEPSEWLFFRNLTRLPLIQLHSPRFFCRPTAFFSTCWSRWTSESSSKSKKKPRELMLNLRSEQWSNILIWQLFENLPKIKYFLAYVNRSIGPTIKIILSVQDYRQEFFFRNLTRLPLIQLHSPRFFCRPTAFFSTCWSRCD
jgi:hypothetical protein